MLDRIYCRTCKRLFPDVRETRKAEKEITYGQFMFNQQRIMWDEPVEFTGNKRAFIINCPYCNSMHTVNATEIMEIIKLSESKDEGGRFKKGNIPKNTMMIPRKLQKTIKTAMKDFKYDEQHS